MTESPDCEESSEEDEEEGEEDAEKRHRLIEDLTKTIKAFCVVPCWWSAFCVLKNKSLFHT